MPDTILETTINLLGAVVSTDKFNQLIHSVKEDITIQGTRSIYVESAKRILDEDLTTLIRSHIFNMDT
jgi:hypothetical protein